MSGAAPDTIERARRDAAHSLPAECQSDFLRLSRSLIHGPTFQWLLVEAPDESLRRRVMAALESVLRAARLSSSTLPLSQKITDVAELERRLVSHAQRSVVVHVIGRPGWFDTARWDAFNARRERLASDARARLVFWLDAEAIELASRSAPDLWAWRAGVYSFSEVAQSITSAPCNSPERTSIPFQPSVDLRTADERRQRVTELRTWLQTIAPPFDDFLVGPVDELGRLLFALGDYDEALQHWLTVELPLHHRRGNVVAEAITKSKIADLFAVRGQLDEALHIHQEEALPVFERLGYTRNAAIAKGKIADILQVRGRFDEALRILQVDVLPAFEKLGDVREIGVTKGRIADVLQARGQLDEALRIRREEEIPIFKQLGDIHATAATNSRIADILQARGQLDEALRIRREEELPVFERLGDARAVAFTKSRIADVLQDRGQLEEALYIREEILLTFDRLGDVRAVAKTRGEIADILQARGQFGEAMRIRQEEELPAFERLGDSLSAAVTRSKIAQQLFDLGERDMAGRLFRQALNVFKELNLPVADTLHRMMAERDLPTSVDTPAPEQDV
ncbi:MAG: tetratricopeptide repeat protein [Leptothrix sp. (in: b-proteobacteria)]